MRIVSINQSQVALLKSAEREVRSAIIKQPVTGSVWLSESGLEGDEQADLDNHGGQYRAIYAYPLEHYTYWSRTHGIEGLGPGRFGENLTLTGLTEHEVSVGDIFCAGDALLEVTQPRTACFKLGMSLNRPDFPGLFLSSGRVGFFMRVVLEGMISTGIPFKQVHREEDSMSISELGRIYRTPADLEGAERALQCLSLAPEWQEYFNQRLSNDKVVTH